MHVPDNADNFTHRRFAEIRRPIRNDSFSDRIFAGEEFLSETFRYDRDWRRVSVVAICKCTSMTKRNPHRPKIIRGDDVDLRQWQLPGGHRMFLDVEIKGNFAATEGNPPRGNSRLHTGERRHAFQELFVERGGRL